MLLCNLTSKDRLKLPTEVVFLPEQFENALNIVKI